MKKKAAITVGMIGIVILVISVISKIKEYITVSIIGGADGPTAIFLAGKIGNTAALPGIGIGVVLLILAIILWIRKKNRNL